MTGRDSPEIVVKFWPPSITARGARAIDAVRRPLAFVMYARPVVAVIFGTLCILEGKAPFVAAFNYLKRFY